MWYQCFSANRGKGLLCDESLLTGLHWFPEQVYCCWHPCWRDKDLLGWEQAQSHPDRWLLLWVQRVCCAQCVGAVMPTYDKWSVCFTLIFHTAITQFSGQCIFTEIFVVFLDLAESLRGKKGNNDNPITTFHPSARRIQWYKPKFFW